MYLCSGLGKRKCPDPIIRVPPTYYIHVLTDRWIGAITRFADCEDILHVGGTGAKVENNSEQTKFCTMKVVELVKISTKILEMMSNSDIRTGDYKFVEMYEEYKRLRNAGEKYWYIIASLAERYSISESSVKRLIRRFENEVKP